MTILFVLVPVALGIVLISVGGFVWATRTGQFDDLDTPALRVLRDEPGGQTSSHSSPPLPQPPLNPAD